MRFYISEISVSCSACFSALLAPLCVTVLDIATHRLFGSSQLAYICLSICRAVLPGLVACPICLPGSCCMWQQREAAATRECSLQLTCACLIAFELAPWAATDADSCGCTLRLKLLPPSCCSSSPACALPSPCHFAEIKMLNVLLIPVL